jgi:hypothetical protein
MPDEKAKLKLGKGAAFVKSRLRQLRLNDDIWEADFGLLDDGVTWLGLVVCPTSGAIFASEICDHPPDVNDLANLLAACDAATNIWRFWSAIPYSFTS